MSRYAVPALNPDLVIVVGWDNPFQTFFGQVFDPQAPEDTDDCLHWYGDRPCAHLTVDSLQAAMAEWVLLLPEVRAQLAQDQDTATIPPSLQRRMVAMAKEGDHA